MIKILLHFISFLKVYAGTDMMEISPFHYVKQLHIFILLNSTFFMFALKSILVTLLLLFIIPIFFIQALILFSFIKFYLVLFYFLTLLYNYDNWYPLIMIRLSKICNHVYYSRKQNNEILNFDESSIIAHSSKGNHILILCTDQYVLHILKISSLFNI